MRYPLVWRTCGRNFTLRWCVGIESWSQYYGLWSPSSIIISLSVIDKMNSCSSKYFMSWDDLSALRWSPPVFGEVYLDSTIRGDIWRHAMTYGDTRRYPETLEGIRRHSQISGDVWTPLETSTRNYSKIVDNSAVWNNCYLSTGKLAKWFQNYDKWKTIYDVVWMIDSIDSIRLVVFFIERFAFIRVAIITNITSLSTGNVHLLSRHSLLTQINSS